MTESKDLRQEFKAQLSTLRQVVGRAIQQQSLADIEEGMNVYQQLLHTCLEYFSAFTDDEPVDYYYMYSTSGLDGSQLRWLLEDYLSFITQGAVTRSTEVGITLSRSVLSAEVECVRSGDVGALTMFSSLTQQLWRESGPDSSAAAFKDLGAYLVRLQTSLVQITAGATPNNRLTQARLMQCLAAETVTFNEFAKAAIDDGSAERLQIAVEGAFSALGDARAYLTDIRSLDNDPEMIRNTITSWLSALVVGLHGWILHLGGTASLPEDSGSMRFLLEAFAKRGNPWSATPYIVQFGVGGMFGWTRWELSESSTHGFFLDISRNVRQALLIEAISQDLYAEYDALLRMTGSNEAVRDFADQLLTDLKALAERDLVPGGAAAESRHRAALSEVLRRARNEIARDLAGTELSPSRIDEFRRALLLSRRSGSALDIFATHLVSRETAIQADAKSAFLRIGNRWSLSREYFVETPVSAEPGLLAFNISRSILASEITLLEGFLEQWALTSIVSFIEAPARVLSELAHVRSAQSPPIIVFDGPWSFVDHFGPLGVEWDESEDGWIRHGSLLDASVHWIVTADRANIYLFPKDSFAITEWVQQESEGDGAVEENGRLLIEILDDSTQGVSTIIPDERGDHASTPRDEELKSADFEAKVIVAVIEECRLKHLGGQATKLQVLVDFTSSTT